MTINHELCSELLGPFLRDEVDVERRREVEVHLASCEACREELRALEALNAPGTNDMEPLGGLERARLHRAVWAAVGSLPRPERKTLGARLLPYLGTAAVLALFAVGAVTLSAGGDDDSSGDAARQEVSTDAFEEHGLDTAGAEADAGGGDDSTRSVAESPLANEDSAALDDAKESTVSVETGDTVTQYAVVEPFAVGCGVGLGSP